MLLSAGMAVAASAQQPGQLSQQPSQERDWPTYGHDAGGMRYSPLRQIDTSNVTQLQPAWT